jgi:hypothetical protein
MADDAVVTEVKPDIEDKGSSFDPVAFQATVLEKVAKQIPEIEERVSAKTKQQIVDAIVGEQGKDKGPWVPKSYEEIIERAVEKVKEVNAQTEKERAEADSKSKQEQEKQIEANNEYWDRQIADLEVDGLLPKMPEEIVAKLAENKPLSEKDQKDPSIKARQELYAKSKELKDSGDQDWWNFKYVAHKFGIGKEKEFNAPVLTRSSYSGGDNKSPYTFEEIRGAGRGAGGYARIIRGGN